MRDTESFDEFYRATSRRLLSYCYALTGDLGHAQDLVQETYLRAWQRWRHLASYGNAEAWLRLVAGRLATDLWRRARHLRAALVRAGRPDAPAAPGEDAVLVARALRALPEGQRRVLALHYLFDLSVAEIAAETGTPVGTVKSWLTRGRTALAAQLHDGTGPVGHGGNGAAETAGQQVRPPKEGRHG